MLHAVSINLQTQLSLVTLITTDETEKLHKSHKCNLMMYPKALREPAAECETLEDELYVTKLQVLEFQ